MQAELLLAKHTITSALGSSTESWQLRLMVQLHRLWLWMFKAGHMTGGAVHQGV